jgi:fructose-1,6-bisphosphatase/inositol monophosphatase family enzyme
MVKPCPLPPAALLITGQKSWDVAAGLMMAKKVGLSIRDQKSGSRLPLYEAICSTRPLLVRPEAVLEELVGL